MTSATVHLELSFMTQECGAAFQKPAAGSDRVAGSRALEHHEVEGIGKIATSAIERVPVAAETRQCVIESARRDQRARLDVSPDEMHCIADRQQRFWPS